MKKLIYILFYLAVPLLSNGQNPAPAATQQKRILLMGGIIHTGDGKIINNGAVGFENGKLILVADATVTN